MVFERFERYWRRYLPAAIYKMLKGNAKNKHTFYVPILGNIFGFLYHIVGTVASFLAGFLCGANILAIWFIWANLHNTR